MTERYFTISGFPPVPGSVLLTDTIKDDFNLRGRIDQVPRISQAGRQLGQILGQTVEPPTATRVIEVAEKAMVDVIDPNVPKHFGHRDFLLETLESAIPELEERKQNV